MKKKKVTIIAGHKGVGKSSIEKETAKFIQQIGRTNREMFKNQLLVDMEATFKKCLETAVRKNADYSGVGENVDPYKNFRGSEFVGVSPDRDRKSVV
jgi:hypothetical protein